MFVICVRNEAEQWHMFHSNDRNFLSGWQVFIDFHVSCY